MRYITIPAFSQGRRLACGRGAPGKRRTAVACALLLSAFSTFAVEPARAAETDLNALNARISSLIEAQRFTEALAASDAYLALMAKRSGEDSADFAAALSRKAAVYHVQGRLADADPLFVRSLELFRKHRPRGDPDIATALNNIGMQHCWLGRYSEAPRYLEEALHIRERALKPDDPAIAESLSNLAYSYIHLGRSEEALPLTQRALSIIKTLPNQNDRRIGNVYQNLASALEYQGDLKSSTEALSQAARIYAAALPEHHAFPAGVFSKLGVSLYLQRRFADAEKAFEEAVRRQRMAPVTLTNPSTMTDFALNQMELGKLDQANTLIEEALAQRMALLPPQHLGIGETLSDLAEVQLRRNNPKDALDLARKSVKINAERDRLNDRSRRQFLRHVQIAWQFYDGSGRSDGDLAAEALLSGQHAARGDTAQTVTRMGARLATRDPVLQELVRKLDDLDKQQPGLEQDMSRQLALAPAERDMRFAGLQDEMRAIEIKRRALKDTISTSFPEYERLVRPAPLPADDISALLDHDEALVFILPAYEETFVWALTREQIVWDRAEISLADAKSWVTQLRAGIDALDKLRKNERPPLFDLAFAHEFYLKLFKGIEPALSGKKHLIVVPTGPYDAIPFHFLVKEKPPVRRPTLKQLPLYKRASWLIRDHAISVLPAVANFKTLRGVVSNSTTDGGLIAFANPTFAGERGVATKLDARAGEVEDTTTTPPEAVAIALAEGWADRRATFDALVRLPPLADTEDEVRTVARLIEQGRADVIVKSAATEVAVKSADLKSYRTVFFATHGLKAEDIPGLSEPALALSVPARPSEADDGLLTASEIAELQLDADLVVLSACNTAAPRTPTDEGLSGLAQAFFHAGARSLLVSHWNVPSEAAAKLTTAMFKTLREKPGMRRAEALRLSMLSLIDDPSFVMNPYPAFWAPFVIVGDR